MFLRYVNLFIVNCCKNTFSKVCVTVTALDSVLPSRRAVVNVIESTGDKHPNFSFLNVDILGIDIDAGKVVG